MCAYASCCSMYIRSYYNSEFQSHTPNPAAWPALQAHLTLVLDGYSAPLTAGNFVRNVLEGAYTNAELKVDQGAVLAGGGAAGGET